MPGNTLSVLVNDVESRQADEKALKILLSVPEDMSEGSRRIIECPVCGHKVYVLRDSGKVRVSCGGCKIDASGLWVVKKTIDVNSKSHI